ncbi:MAG TPA: hypothetical protein VG965_05215 [Patescibacteria group bacterium]|nr:hypothetical protein [Patescibacteria group bacterium]
MKQILKFKQLLFILVFTFLASFSLLNPGLFTMHDDEQVARLYDLNQALVQGQFPPRIAPNLGFGYGYPFFNYYPSFSYYVGEAFHVFGFSYINSTKLMLAAGFFLAACFMYLFVSELLDEWAGIVAACAYTFAPYHAVDIYVRGAFAEFFAFVFIPAIFWASYKLYKSSRPIFAIPLAISVGFLILSHDLIALMCTPFIGIWLLYLLFKAENRKQFVIWCSTGFILGFGLSAFFWFPAYIERNFTLVRILTSELASYTLHFTCIHQLWSSPWGYGGSIPDCNDGLSFEIGKPQLILSLVSLIAFVVGFVKYKKKENLTIIPLLFFMLFLAMFLTTRQSKFVWDNISLLWYVQFPWRFLTICAFAASFLSGCAVFLFANKKHKTIAALGLTVIFVAFYIGDFRPERFLNVSDKYYTDINKIRWDTSSLSYEYVPAGVKTKISKYGTTLVDINKNEVAKEPYTVIHGSAIITNTKNVPQEKIFKTNSTSSLTIRINTFSFPGWKVFIDGGLVKYSDSNKLKLIDVAVPAGTHTVSAVFENTTPRSLGNWASITSIIGLCGILISASYKHEKNK